MTKAEQFREYAKEALGSSYRSRTENEKRAFIHLASIWTRAAMYRETTFVEPPEEKLPVQARFSSLTSGATPPVHLCVHDYTNTSETYRMRAIAIITACSVSLALAGCLEGPPGAAGPAQTLRA